MSGLTLDQNLTELLYSLSRSNPHRQKIVYLVAAYPVFLLPVVLLWLFYRRSTRFVAVKIFIFTVLTWQGLNRAIGAFLYDRYGWRDRPFASSGLKEFLFEQPQKSFPSDHAAVLMFATLALFYYRQKTLGWVFLAATLISSFARVIIGFHYVGDILGGWLIGILGFGLLLWLDKPFQKLLDRAEPLLRIKDEPTNI